MVEAGEEPLAAAIREVREETLIADLQFAWGEVYTETGPYSRGKVARYYIASTETTAESRSPSSRRSVAPSTTNSAGSITTGATRLVSPRVQPIVDWAWQQIAE